MKRFKLLTITMLSAMLVFVIMPVTTSAQGTFNGNGYGFVDNDGDGINDNAPDADGDGIPNGMDPDYVPAGNSGTGGYGHGPMTGHGSWFVDEDGDGFNDNAPDADGDGIPNGQDPDWTPTGDCPGGGSGYGHGGWHGGNGGQDDGGMNPRILTGKIRARAALRVVK